MRCGFRWHANHCALQASGRPGAHVCQLEGEHLPPVHLCGCGATLYEATEPPDAG